MPLLLVAALSLSLASCSFSGSPTAHVIVKVGRIPTTTTADTIGVTIRANGKLLDKSDVAANQTHQFDVHATGLVSVTFAGVCEVASRPNAQSVVYASLNGKSCTA